jgi:ParB family chromosome partitioning protein
MARRRRLEAPGAEELAQIEAGFAAKSTPDRIGLTAPIAQIAGDIARASEPLDIEKRVSNAQDSVDAKAWRQAVGQGRVISDLALDQIDLDYMMRDRIVVEASEIDELKTSILAHGLRLPVEVVAMEDGRYGLVSGWRRITVLRQLQDEDPDAWSTVKAIIRPPYEAAELYTAMVEENELRSQVTPYERGRIAVVAASLGAFADTDSAIDTIFAAASKAKRSKIRSFAFVHDELGDMLKFPTDLSERNGLRLAYALREDYGQQMRAALFGTKSTGPAMEWAVLEPIVAAAEAVERLPDTSRGGRPKTRFAKTTRAAEGLANGVTMERVLHEDGYSIRLRGAVVDVVMVDQLMDELRRWLSRLPG